MIVLEETLEIELEVDGNEDDVNLLVLDEESEDDSVEIEETELMLEELLSIYPGTSSIMLSL